MEHDIAHVVMNDIEERAQVGKFKYGERLKTGLPCANGLSALENAYEEVLDTAIYLKKAILDAAAED